MLNEYTEYMLNKCLNDENEKELHDKIESIAQMHVLGLISVKTYISEVTDTVAYWLSKMIPEQDYGSVHGILMYAYMKTMFGYSYTPKDDIISKKPTDAKDNFFKHLAIVMGVDYDMLSFKIYLHYREVAKNGNK